MGFTSATMTSLAILVVEDEAITLEYLVTTLARKYPEVAIHKALNGATGLDVFMEHRPGIVITDINMPVMGGMKMADKMRAIKPDTKFIVLTGDSGGLTAGDTAGDGLKIDHYIEKPISFQDLFSAIELCIGEISHR